MTPSHYTLPDGNVQIAFSGGRTSAYMLHKILEANGGLPDRARVVFTNTGREFPQTLDFVAEVGQRFGVLIEWVEYRQGKPGFEVVGRQGASENGEPFDALIDQKKYLPNQQVRFCTTELKTRPAKKYLMSLGWQRWTSALGIRADEAHRSVNPPKDRWTNWRPLVAAGVSKADVSEFWAQQPFDLRLPNIGGKTPLGNCDGCFLKSEANLAALHRKYPDRAAWWQAMEARAGRLAKKGAAQWSSRYTRADLHNFVDAQGDWIFSDESALCQADGGECV